jgi:GDPmannose 4,6-dehydratase
VRGETFVTRKITRGLARIKLNLQDRLYMGNLNSRRDWGHARDYVKMQWLMLQAKEPKDYVIATGEQHSVREFIEKSCAALDINIRWEGEGENEKGYDQADRCIVEVDPGHYRPTEVESLLGDPGKAHRELGWRPETSFDQLVQEMIEGDLKLARREETLRHAKLA